MNLEEILAFIDFLIILKFYMRDALGLLYVYCRLLYEVFVIPFMGNNLREKKHRNSRSKIEKLGFAIF